MAELIPELQKKRLHSERMQALLGVGLTEGDRIINGIVAGFDTRIY